MKNTPEYIKTYFEGNLQESDLPLTNLKVAIDKFLELETKEKALDVYTAFFDCFRIKLEGGSFIDLLDALLAYEENSAVLLEKQRDHLVHSVNVFILGLSIFGQNTFFRKAFRDTRCKPYDGAQSTPSAEFLFRWGLAALLHDIGYPIEIIHNQFKSFISFIGDVYGDKGSEPYLDYFHFDTLDSISEILFKSAFTGKFTKTLPESLHFDTLKPTHLLAYNFHSTLGVPYEEVKNVITNFLSVMQKGSFVDHGYYSAIILLKWYGYLIQRSGFPSDILYNPILDSAGAIFLHNFYRMGLMKPPFSLGALSVWSHPIGFLLILCDELQEWNRTAYGSKDKKRVLAEASAIEIGDGTLDIHYITTSGVMDENFGDEKTKFLQNVLLMSDIFPYGVKITQTTRSDFEIHRRDDITPRPLLSNLERMAKIIHANYNEMCKSDEKVVLYPTWEKLPDDLKYSNVRQARGVYEKLRLCGWTVSDKELPQWQEVESFTPEQIEMLALEEHDEWLSERIAGGWTLGERDNAKKTNPYLIPYSSLPEKTKEYDRDVVRNIFPMLKQLGLRVYKTAEK
jgi:hypothetical protein